MTGEDHYHVAEQLLDLASALDLELMEKWTASREAFQAAVKEMSGEAIARQAHAARLTACAHGELANAAFLADFLRTAVTIAETLNRVLFDASDAPMPVRRPT